MRGEEFHEKKNNDLIIMSGISNRISIFLCYGKGRCNRTDGYALMTEEAIRTEPAMLTTAMSLLIRL